MELDLGVHGLADHLFAGLGRHQDNLEGRNRIDSEEWKMSQNDLFDLSVLVLFVHLLSIVGILMSHQIIFRR